MGKVGKGKEKKKQAKGSNGPIAVWGPVAAVVVAALVYLVMRSPAQTQIEARIEECAFERIDASVAQEAVFQRKSPFVLTNLPTTAKWQAFDSWRDPQQFSATYGNLSIELRPWKVPPTGDPAAQTYQVSEVVAKPDDFAGYISIQFKTLETHKRLKGDLSPFPQLLRPVRLEPGFSLGFGGIGSGSHAHDRTLFVQIAGRKWWAIAPPGQADMSDPCGWKAPAKIPERYSGCTVGPGEAIYWPPMWQHATCNLDPWVIGIPFRGDATWWPPILHDVVDGKDVNCRQQKLSSDTLILAGTVAVAYGQVASLGNFLDCGLPINDDFPDTQEINSIRDKEFTLLQLAAGRGHVEAIDVLLQRGANDAPDKFGAVAAHYAAVRGHVGVLSYLESAGHDMNAGSQISPLEVAALKDRVGVIEFLLSYKPPSMLIHKAVQHAKKASSAKAEALLTNALKKPKVYDDL